MPLIKFSMKLANANSNSLQLRTIYRRDSINATFAKMFSGFVRKPRTADSPVSSSTPASKKDKPQVKQDDFFVEAFGFTATEESAIRADIAKQTALLQKSASTAVPTENSKRVSSKPVEVTSTESEAEVEFTSTESEEFPTNVKNEAVSEELQQSHYTNLNQTPQSTQQSQSGSVPSSDGSPTKKAPPPPPNVKSRRAIVAKPVPVTPQTEAGPEIDQVSR